MMPRPATMPEAPKRGPLLLNSSFCGIDSITREQATTIGRIDPKAASQKQIIFRRKRKGRKGGRRVPFSASN